MTRTKKRDKKQVKDKNKKRRAAKYVKIKLETALATSLSHNELPPASEPRPLDQPGEILYVDPPRSKNYYTEPEIEHNSDDILTQEREASEPQPIGQPGEIHYADPPSSKDSDIEPEIKHHCDDISTEERERIIQKIFNDWGPFRWVPEAVSEVIDMLASHHEMVTYFSVVKLFHECYGLKPWVQQMAKSMGIELIEDRLRRERTERHKKEQSLQRRKIALTNRQNVAAPLCDPIMKKFLKFVQHKRHVEVASCCDSNSSSCLKK